ncbi:MAG: cisplatin damage response ATP-dependent DNA ligase, partial [Verrucomicrobiota bacterium]|nr:cisplatin damage response ATP-dependent DNA ligase [Verrucomicrobiota bacterium]
RRELLLQTWRQLNSSQRLVWNKLITGQFRIGVSKTLVIRALAQVAGIAPAIMAHRVLGEWKPTEKDLQKILSGATDHSETAQPYPFFLASPIEAKIKTGETFAEILGDIEDWQIEWKWDGIRAQLIHRNNEICIWSRGDEMVTEMFPEIRDAGNALPNGAVFDGEIVAWQNGRVSTFTQLQRRLGRKKVSVAIQTQFPVAFLAYDLLEFDGNDWRAKPLRERRAKLKMILEQTWQNLSVRSKQETARVASFLFHDFEKVKSSAEVALRLSPIIEAKSWDELTQIQLESRARGAEGLMLKRSDSAYGVGRQRGDWWKWKIDPFLIDAVLIYAQRGHGRRASLFSDYTFGLWENGKLIPIAKAYSGLTDEEIRQVDSFVRSHTLEKHGSVSIVQPELVFELAFEGIQKSSRHKSGIAVRFPRMNRWRQDKKSTEADTLENLKNLLESETRIQTGKNSVAV